MRHSLGVILCLVGMAACANSKGRDCDPAVEVCPAVDGPPPVFADAPIDGPPLRGFGEVCTDRDQCASNLCILVGTSGQCTMTCGVCPDGYGCLGVLGIDIKDQITFVCVPESTQLCSPCTDDSECTLIGMDKCVPYPDGDNYCGQDCSTVSCPTGFDCNTIDIGGTEYEQCMAASGACDCTEANPGAMQPCNIATPWNVCVGSQTCGGASGWGSCEPPSMTDDPDDGYVDSNCDGIDGDVARGIFVSPAGANTGSCGLTYMTPCQTLAFATFRATSTGRPHVYAQAGTYTGSLTMANGISIFGGYDFNWQRAAYSMPGHQVSINGGAIAVRFDGLSAPTWLDNVVVNSSAAGPGASSIGILITASSNTELRGVLVNPGPGGAGSSGGNGMAGPIGGNGGPGAPGCEDSSGFCSNCSQPVGGAGGASSCGRTGGTGGRPGNGGGGGQTGGTGVGGTSGGGGGPGGGYGSGIAGANGLPGGPGGPGTGGAAFGSFSGFTYLPSDGTIGGTGSGGNGGGGGGGGGGGDDACDSYGSSGGGGGAGGCGGTPGSGGFGGGGSFGLVALDSLVVVQSSIINGGAGGVGGNGGAGGAGGAGGPFGAAGPPPDGGGEQDDGGQGARGGTGGDGGAGGDGGGGGGGPSIGVVCLGTSTSLVSVFASTLMGGGAGAGGASAAPGSAGTSAPTYNCPF